MVERKCELSFSIAITKCVCALYGSVSVLLCYAVQKGEGMKVGAKTGKLICLGLVSIETIKV